MAMPAKNIEAEIVRGLVEGDLALLQENRGTKAPLLKKIRAVHHAVARMASAGIPDGQISESTGLCASRISILKADPAFQELVSFYSEREDARFADVQERAKLLGITAMEVLHDRLLEEPEIVATKDLIDITKVALDRGGHAPTQRKELSVSLPTRIERVIVDSPGTVLEGILVEERE